MLLKTPLHRYLLACCLVVFFSVASLVMNRVWATEESLWAQSVHYGGDSIAHHNYAMSQVFNNDEKARQHFQRALELDSNNVRSYISLGLLQIRTGEPEKGLKTVRHAVERAPNWAFTHYWYSKALSQLGKTALAAAESRQAAELEPRNPQFLYQAAHDAIILEDYGAAIPFLESLHRVQSPYQDSYFLLAFALQSLGRNSEAIEYYKRHLAVDSSHIKSQFNLAYAYLQTEQMDLARQALERTLELDPDHRAAKYHQEHIAARREH